MNSSSKLLVVDDDPELRELTQAYLMKNGFIVNTVESSLGMDEFLATNDVDLLILDLMLPGEHGLAIAKRLKKKKDLPIIILSAQGEDIDRIVGLEIGADDYLAKPFNPRELLARIRAVLRRSSGKIEEKEKESSRLVFNDFELDLNAHSLSRGGEKVSLTSGEFDLLALLAANPNRVLHRDTILDRLTGAERSPFDRSIDVRVTRLRGKLEFDPSKPELIKTIWGKGYMFCPSQDG
jgi:two-component system phosphate regulon response regulator OmpR